MFNFFPMGAPAKGLSDLACRYWEITPSIRLSGPTSFAPPIHYVRDHGHEELNGDVDGLELDILIQINILRP